MQNTCSQVPFFGRRMRHECDKLLEKNHNVTLGVN